MPLVTEETEITRKLHDKEKAAVLLISLGTEPASKLYKSLNDDEIENLTFEISKMKTVDTVTRETVLKDFYDMCVAKKYINEGGIDFARALLQKAMGEDKANEVLDKLTSSLQVRPFDFVKHADPNHLLNLIQRENPQTIALVFSYLSPGQAGELLAELPPEMQAEIAERIALISRTSPEYVKEVEAVLERKLSNMGGGEYAAVDGLQAIVDIINAVDRSTERNILETLEAENGPLADEIRRRMFVFEDIIKLSNRHIQRVLKDVENSDITVALKGTNEDVMKKIFENVSKRSKELIEEEMQYMGPVRLKDVEEAQQRIVNVIRRLEDAGEIIIARGQEDEMVV